MATNHTTAELAALDAAIASGELRVTYNGHTREYRSIADLERARGIVAAALADAAGTRVRVVRAYSTKGT